MDTPMPLKVLKALKSQKLSKNKPQHLALDHGRKEGLAGGYVFRASVQFQDVKGQRHCWP